MDPAQGLPFPALSAGACDAVAEFLGDCLDEVVASTKAKATPSSGGIDITDMKIFSVNPDASYDITVPDAVAPDVSYDEMDCLVADPIRFNLGVSWPVDPAAVRLPYRFVCGVEFNDEVELLLRTQGI